jgi:transcriptional regulator with XRE-family HTH domain
MNNRRSSNKQKGSPVTAEIAFGQLVREYRIAKGMTQADLEAESHIDRSFISQIENGKKQACLKTIITIAAKLGVSPGDLVNEAVAQIDRKELKKLL